MERLAEQAQDVRSEFVELLREHRNFSPAWEPADAAHALSKLYELDSNAVQGIGLLYEEFFRLRNEDNPSFDTVGPQIVDRMVELGGDEDTIAILRRHLPSTEVVAEASPEIDQLAAVSVTIIYIGGNETQASYEGKLREKLSKTCPGLRLKTVFPGWGSNWVVYLDQVKSMLPEADAVVLNKLVRTQFGRAVRKHCNNDVPWWPCTGRGLKALKSSIEAAASWAAARKTSSSN
jgi:hypothetical protein